VTELLFAKEGSLRFVPMGMVVCIRHIQLQRDFHTCVRRLEAYVSSKPKNDGANTRPRRDSPSQRSLSRNVKRCVRAVTTRRAAQVWDCLWVRVTYTPHHTTCNVGCRLLLWLWQ
jgi:hypothetical protein